MQLEAISSSRPFLLPDLHRYSGWKGIDRLQVIAAPNRNVSSSSASTIMEMALARLEEAGLVCAPVKGDALRIIGGLSCVTKHGMTIYDCPFAINDEPNDRFAATVVSARSFHDETLHFATLDEAVSRIIHAYQRRGMIPVARQS